MIVFVRLRLKFLALWTAEVKRIGKSLVWFLLQVIRDWTPEEVHRHFTAITHCCALYPVYTMKQTSSKHRASTRRRKKVEAYFAEMHLSNMLLCFK